MPRGPEHSPQWGGARPNSGPKKSRSRSAAPVEPPQPDLPGIPAAPAASINQRFVDLTPELLDAFRAMQTKVGRTKLSRFDPFKLPAFPPIATPPKEVRMAMDEQLDWAQTQWAGANGGVLDAYIAEGLAFPGYTYLAELMQRSEYRVLSETIAEDSTRAWVDYETVSSKTDPKLQQRMVDSGGDPDERQKQLKDSGKLDKIKQLRDDQENLGIKNVFYDLIAQDGEFGRTHLFTDLGDDLDALGGSNPELAIPIGNGRDAVSKAKIAWDPSTKIGKLRAFRVIEPIWCYPTTYNAMSPLRHDYYNPQNWYVMGQNVAISRLRPFVTRPVPDILKAAYAFGGISLSQLAEPYVNIWLQTRQSVANLVKGFSTMVLQADLAQNVTPGGQGANSLIARALAFNAFRDNMGLFVVDKNKEDVKNVAAPLGSLDHLQAQSQEHMASVGRQPLVKLTGISPSGLNATSEFEIKVYDDGINAFQNRRVRPMFNFVFWLMQLNRFGEIDPEITYDFAPLRQMTEQEKAEKEEREAKRDEIWVNIGAISPAEVRKRVIDDPELPYGDLDPDDVPEPPAEEEGDMLGGGEGDEHESEGSTSPAAAERPGGADSVSPFAADEWREAAHPRAPDGKFGSGGGGGGGGGGGKNVVKLYHGTAKANLESIMKDGLRRSAPSRGGDFWAEKNWPTDSIVINKRPASVFSTDNKAVAQYFAKIAAEVTGGDPVILELSIPEADFYKGFRPDEEFVSSGPEHAYRIAGDIPPAWIKGLALDAAQPGRSIYVVVVPDDGLPGEQALDADFVEGDHPRDPAGKFTKGGGGSAGKASILAKNMEQVGDQKGSNPGGVYKDKTTGKEFYIKTLKSRHHAANETLAANLFKMAGGNTLDYHEVKTTTVKGGTNVATAIAKLDKANLSKLNGNEIKAAQDDFIANAWLANWDAAGTGGDNVGVVDGKVTTLDFGGALAYRAKGEPKGDAFGDTVQEIDTMRDKDVSPDSAKLYGGMSDFALATSALKVTKLTNDQIIDAVKDAGGSWHLAQKLIARKNYIAKEFDLPTDTSAWDDSKHPRNPDGTFKEGPGEPTIPQAAAALEDDDEAIKPGAYGGLYITSGASPQENHSLTVSKVSTQPVQIGIHYRRMLARLIKDAPKYGGGETEVGVLTKKIVESMQASAAKAQKQGKTAEVDKLNAAIAKLGATPIAAASPAAVPAPAPAPKAPAAAPKPAPASSLPTPTPEEMKKAGKGTPVPASMATSSAAQDIIKGFNEKYAGKELTDPAAVAQKIADYKKMTSLVQQVDAAYAAQQADAQKKAQAKAAEALKKEQTAAKEQNAGYMKDLGISEVEATGFHALVDMIGTGSSSKNLVEKFKSYAAQAAKFGFPISGFQYALIRNYINGGYVSVNEALRSGTLTTAQHVYAKLVNSAIDKLPKYTGTVKRGTSLNAQQIAAYKPGHVITEKAFTSTGVGFSFGGNVEYTIKAIGKRGGDFSKTANEHEKEVLFKANTFFLVHKVETKGGTTYIEMEEVEGHG